VMSEANRMIMAFVFPAPIFFSGMRSRQFFVALPLQSCYIRRHRKKSIICVMVIEEEGFLRGNDSYIQHASEGGEKTW
jgi:hypothetical protein